MNAFNLNPTFKTIETNDLIVIDKAIFYLFNGITKVKIFQLSLYVEYTYTN